MSSTESQRSPSLPSYSGIGPSPPPLSPSASSEDFEPKFEAKLFTVNIEAKSQSENGGESPTPSGRVAHLPLRIVQSISLWGLEWGPFLLLVTYFVVSVFLYVVLPKSVIQIFWLFYMTSNFYIAGNTVIKSQTASMDTLRSLSISKIQLPNSRSDPNNEILYLTGLKGLFAFQSFIWVCLDTFIPTLVSAPSSSLNVPGRTYQVIIRKTLSVFFWNENLIYSAFILLSARCISIPFWVQSWAWFSITGLLFADMVHNVSFKIKAQSGIPIPFFQTRFPTWITCALVMLAGFVMQYLWTAWRPEYQNVMLEGHAGLYYSGGLNYKYDVHQLQARDDNYLILVGMLGLVETYDVLQWILSTPVLVYLGRRTLSESLVLHCRLCGNSNDDFRLVPRSKHPGIYGRHQTLASLDRNSRANCSDCEPCMPCFSPSSNYSIRRGVFQIGR
jgi:hypothetical protein